MRERRESIRDSQIIYTTSALESGRAEQEKNMKTEAMKPKHLRFPPWLLRAVKKTAQEENRSFNAQVLALIKEAFEARKGPGPGP